jgi:hypothetical protein
MCLDAAVAKRFQSDFLRLLTPLEPLMNLYFQVFSI